MENQGKQGLKRKRLENSKEDLGTTISGKLHHELHGVHHASKKAKTFETQKLVKRLKQLRTKGEDQSAIQDYEGQLESIKTIDHNRLGNTALKSKVLKDKILGENQLVQDALTREIGSNVLEPQTAGTPSGKVHSRLLSSKTIASQIASSLDSLRAILNPEGSLTKRAKSELSGHAEAASKPRKFAAPPIVPGDDDSAESSDDSDEGGDEDAGWESGTVDGDGDESEEEANGWESGSIDGSEESDDDDDTSVKKSALKAPPKKPTKAVAAALGPSLLKPKAKVESTFLPSLSVGYIPASDNSDVEDEKVDEPRKNRRGQRARRAIWEKKFGRNANHKKSEAAQEKAKKAKPQPVKRSKFVQPTQVDSGYGNHKPSANALHSGSEAPTPPATAPRGRAPGPFRKDTSDKPIHPSWEAKRKMKEKQSDAIVPSQGKKIKF